MTATALHLLASSRTNPAIMDVGMCVGLGFFVALLSVALIYFGARKRGQTMDNAFYQKLAMYGFFGLVCGYFAMRVAIKNNPEAFHGKPPLTSKQLKAICENPIPQMPQPKPIQPTGPGIRPPGTRAPEHVAERLRQAEALRAEQDARRAEQAAGREAAKKAEEARVQVDLSELNALTLEELEKVLKQRDQEKKEATEQMRALSAQNSAATPEQRKAASERFSRAVRDYVAASKVRAEKKRQQRELNR